MQTQNRQFLSITPSYKYRSKPHSNKHKRSVGQPRHTNSHKAYRAYDKQDLLQQIENKVYQQNKARRENRLLKQEINKGPGWCAQDNMWSTGQVQLMMVSMQKENQQLTTELDDRNKEIDRLKKSVDFTKYTEVSVSCQALKEELLRLNAMAREKRKKKIERRRTLNRQVSQHLVLMANKERDIRQISIQNQQLKSYLAELEDELGHFKSKNKQLEKKKRRLADDTLNMGMKFHSIQSADSPKLARMRSQEHEKRFNQAIRTKSSKQTAPATILELQEESELNQTGEKQQYNKNGHSHDSDQSSNISSSSALSEQGSAMEGRLDDSF